MKTYLHQEASFHNEANDRNPEFLGLRNQVG